MKVAVRLFNTKNKIVTQEDKKTILPKLYQKGWSDPKHHTIVDLQEIVSIQDLALVVPTQTNPLVIVDFDIQEDFDTALLLNSSLPEEHQCKYIVTSSRKGGHFYYLPTEGISPLHTDKSVKVDILSIGNNAIAATPFDSSKRVISNSNELTQIHPLMLHYLNSLILAQAQPTSKKVYLTSQESHSDDNHVMVEEYILNRLDPQKFYDYYNLPKTIPEGESWSILQSLAYRLLNDETLTHEVVIHALGKYDPNHRQNHLALAPYESNKFIENKQSYTLTLEHSDFKTPVSVYLDRDTGDHIVQYSLGDGEPSVVTIPTESKAKNLVEKMVRIKKSRINWHLIRDIKVVHSYEEIGGFNYEKRQFNKAYINSYLKAFQGTKPKHYEKPTNLINMLKYMWEEEFDYLLWHTQYRYRTFEHSPVIHHIVGVEGSGKNMTEQILNKGFSEESQELDYQLFMDKHSNHQVQPNTVLGEVGNWNKIQQEEALSKIKTMSGNQGKTVIRGMQQMPVVVRTINKIWVLGNSWIKLHDNPLTQRRVHAVYMPKPLTTMFGGPYEPVEIEEMLSEQHLVNFYYWLGNEFTPERLFVKGDYMSAVSRQSSKSYHAYLDSVEGKSDKIIKLLAELDYQKLLEALHVVDSDISQITFKYNKQGLLVVAIASLKLIFAQVNGSANIYRALLDLNAQKEGGKLLRFDRTPEKYLTIYGAPHGLDSNIKTEDLSCLE